VGRDAGWDQAVVTIVSAIVLIVGYALLQAAHVVSRRNREKNGASF
jgi:predicted cobalt transporter CbtA